MLILPAEADEAVVSGALDRITRIVSEAGGAVGKVDRWGRHPLRCTRAEGHLRLRCRFP